MPPLKDTTTYILKVNDGDKSLLRILEALQKLGNDGSSRSVVIKEGRENHQDLELGWDGDGADKIYDIKVEQSKEINSSTSKSNKNVFKEFIDFNKHIANDLRNMR